MPQVSRHPRPPRSRGLPDLLPVALAFLLCLAGPLPADGPGRIYTQTQAADTGGISGRVEGATLTHAMAIERDRRRVFLAALANGGKEFNFSHLPVGRYDLVLISNDGRVAEGIGLGDAPAPAGASADLLAKRVALADTFFNRHVVHRLGYSGDIALVFVERIRDKTILRQSGEVLDAFLRRFEIIELQQAGDDWQMLGTRHVYREEIPKGAAPGFFLHFHLPALGGLRVADATRDAGSIAIPRE